MSEWQGSGLPPSATARIKRARESGFRFSQLAVASHLSVEACGLEPVATVIGCTARRLDWGEFGLGEVGCGYVSSRTLRSTNVQTTGNLVPVATEARQGRAPLITDANLVLQTIASTAMRTSATAGAATSDFVVYVDPARAGWQAAVDRMLLEAGGLGADGVVSVDFSEREGSGAVRQFVVRGTAVRSKGSSHLKRPFATTLSGTDVGKLMMAGWMPVSIVLGLSIAISHDKARARAARARITAAREITPISELVHAARKHARSQVESRTREANADGAVLSSQMTLSIEEHSVNAAHHDIVAQARATATAVVEFGKGSTRPAGSRPVIPLTG